MMEKQKVWVPDPVEGFILGIIQDLGHNGDAAIVPVSTKYPKQTCSLDRIYYAEQNEKIEVDDNCKYIILSCFSNG